MTPPVSTSIWHLPITQMGKLAVGLAAFSLLMSFITPALIMLRSQNIPKGSWQETLLSAFAFFMFFFGLVPSVVGLVALTRKHERSWLVWLTLWPGVSAILFILAEFIFPH